MTDPANRRSPAASTAARAGSHDTPPPAVTLGAATAVDAPALIDLHTAAFGADLFSHLMLLGRPPGTHEGLIRRALDAWFADPDAHLVRAVDADGAVVGWACWVRKEAAAAVGAAAEGPRGEEEGEAGAQQQPEQEQEQEEGEPPAAGGDKDGAAGATTGPGALGQRMRADLTRWEAAAHLGGGDDGGGGPGGAYLVLQALATEPACQGRGIGSRLVQWGVERADAQGLACWAHASPAGHGLYARAGFEELGRSDYDLAEWAPGGRAGGRGWGVYTFRYMLRRAHGNTTTTTTTTA